MQRKAELNLLIITAIWGLTFPLVGSALQNIQPINFVALRFLLAAIIMLPFVLKDLKHSSWQAIFYGMLLGLANLGSYGFQAWGLKTIGPDESAFITSTAVVLVPFLMLFYRSHKPTRLDFISSIICLFGLYILTGANINEINLGMFLTVLCAISCAFSIVLTQIASTNIHNVKLLVFYQILFTGLYAFPIGMNNFSTIIWDAHLVFALLYCVIFATVLVFYLQVKYQKHTSAAKAAIIFCAEPIFATIYSWVLFSENITSTVLIGGAVILLSISIPDILKLAVEKNNIKA